jgi:hypothetical protein
VLERLEIFWVSDKTYQLAGAHHLLLVFHADVGCATAVLFKFDHLQVGGLGVLEDGGLHGQAREADEHSKEDGGVDLHVGNVEGRTSWKIVYVMRVV